jgi:RNA polymerase sigma-32 factor
MLSRDEEQELARRWRDEEDVSAAHQLVVSNLRFVVKIAHEYKGYGLRLLDIVQEGNIGLMKAVKKFDPDRGYRLISYAVWWIRAQIHEYIMRSWSLVKLGSGRLKRKLFFKLRSERSRAEQEAAGGETTNRELAERLDVPEELVDEMELRMAARDFSLDAPLAEEGTASHLDMVSDSEPSQEEQLSRHEDRKLLEGVIAETSERLNEKERYILENRLLSEEPQTLAEIGNHYGLSRERARQIESKVLAKLRAQADQMQIVPTPA